MLFCYEKKNDAIKVTSKSNLMSISVAFHEHFDTVDHQIFPKRGLAWVSVETFIH